jgi:hypothetical protein
MSLLDRLLAIGPTIERENLYGSAFKRLALIEAAAGNEAQEADAIAKMKDHYAAAEQIARSQDSADGTTKANLFYPAMNRMAAQLALEGGTTGVAFDPSALEAIRQSMAAAPVDFWSVVGQAELTMYGSLFGGSLANDLMALTQEFSNHFDRVNAPRMWASVYDNARFVLGKYMARAAAPEAAAAKQLLKTLEDFGREKQQIEPQRAVPIEEPAAQKKPRRRRPRKQVRPAKRRKTKH